MSLVEEEDGAAQGHLPQELLPRTQGPSEQEQGVSPSAPCEGLLGAA